MGKSLPASPQFHCSISALPGSFYSSRISIIPSFYTPNENTPYPTHKISLAYMAAYCLTSHLVLLRGHMLAVADEDGSVCLFDLRKQGSSSKLKGIVCGNRCVLYMHYIIHYHT